MAERGDGGSIVNLSSMASTRALDDHIAYCSSKAAVDSLTKVMALELGKHKVINPSGFFTAYTSFVCRDSLFMKEELSKLVDILRMKKKSCLAVFVAIKTLWSANVQVQHNELFNTEKINVEGAHKIVPDRYL